MASSPTFSQNRKIPANLNYHMSWSWSNQPVLWDFYIMFLFVCYYFLSKAWRDRRRLTSYYLDLSYGLLRKTGGKSLHALVGLLPLELKDTSTLSCRRFCEVYWEYRTAGHLVFWKPRPAVELKKVLSVTKHGFVFWAQRKPNTRLEIYQGHPTRI